MIPAVGACSNNGEQRAIKKTPEQTIVAACINAETGVGNYFLLLRRKTFGLYLHPVPALPGHKGALRRVSEATK